MASLDAILAESSGKMGRYWNKRSQYRRGIRRRKSCWGVVGGGEQKQRKRKEARFVCSPRSGDRASKQHSMTDHLLSFAQQQHTA